MAYVEVVFAKRLKIKKNSIGRDSCIKDLPKRLWLFMAQDKIVTVGWESVLEKHSNRINLTGSGGNAVRSWDSVSVCALVCGIEPWRQTLG